MTNEEKKKINDFVKVWSYDSAKSIIIGAIVITVVFMPGFAFSSAIQTDTPIMDSGWKYLLILSLVVLISCFIALAMIKKHPLIIHLFMPFSSLAFAATFFSGYYFYMYKIVKVTSPLFIIGALLGHIVLGASLFYYRYRVYKGYSINLAGSPKYGVIVSGTIIGGIIFRAIMSTMGENIENIVLAFIALFISYTMLCGVVLIMNFVVGMKYRNEIDFIAVKK